VAAKRNASTAQPDKPGQTVHPTWGRGKTSWTREERSALVTRVEQGDKAALPELRAMLNAHPDAVTHMLDLAWQTHLAWAKRVSPKDDLLLPELMPRRVEQMQRELEGPHPTPLERLLCERAATCWFAMYLLEASQPDDPKIASSFAWREHADHMKDRAHARYMTALLTLAKVRRLLRPDVQQVNIAAAGAQQLNVASAGASRLRAPEPPSPLPSTTGTSQPVSAGATEAATHGVTTVR
jgi:hypothetical protein